MVFDRLDVVVIMIMTKLNTRKKGVLKVAAPPTKVVNKIESTQLFCALLR